MAAMRTLPAALFFALAFAVQAQEPLRLAVAGLVHGHVDGFFRAAKSRPDIRIVGIFDPDKGLPAQYASRYGFAGSLFFTDLKVMLDRTRPEAVASFTSTLDHPMVVQAAAMVGIPVMMEKPLAVSMADARAIQSAARRSGIQVIVNYETTWYRSHGEIARLVRDGSLGEIRKLVAMDGHQGPKEINVGPEFLSWLTDPRQNGAGALFDFGCYGANLMTWLMDNQRPVSVSAVTTRAKPDIYPKVDDEATILVEYPRAQGIIQASWNWPFSRKDLEVYGAKGYAQAIGGNVLKVRMPGQKQEEQRTPTELPEAQRDSLSYLTAVVRSKLQPSGLSSLDNNVVVTEILEAARESARTGKKIVLGRAE
jgi:predicted dehydrogenase